MPRPKRAGRWWLAAVGVFGVLLVLSMVDDHQGRPLLGETIVVQTIGTTGILGAAWLAAWPKLREFAADIRTVRDQVQNSHTINLRDDVDGKHDETTGQNVQILEQLEGLRDLVERRFEGVSSDVRGVRRDIGRHSDHLRTHDEELKSLRAKERALERKVGDEPSP